MQAQVELPARRTVRQRSQRAVSPRSEVFPMPNSNDRNNNNNNNGSNQNKPRTSGGIRFAGRRLRDIEREAVLRTLELNGNNQSAAARSLCISRPTLARKLNSYRADDSDRSCNDPS
jgi:DNA-binding NtrC family response regulator